MKPLHPGNEIAEPLVPPASRVVSLDIFRGLVMAVMIFVNDLASVHGLPPWTYHYPANVDAMSYVDMVFPAFLFIVGMSLPLAVRQRLKRDPSVPRLWMHIVIRSLALLVLGLVLANGQSGDAVRMHMSPYAWTLLALIGCVLLWAVYPERVPRRAVVVLRTLGAAVIVLTFALYRGLDRLGHPQWIQFGYPEILGLIGLTYLAVCLLYVPFRHYRWTPLVSMAAMLLLNLLTASKWLNLGHVPLYVFPFGNGAMPACTLAGAALSSVFLGPFSLSSDRRKVAVALGAVLAAALLGLAFAPLGISKIRATPTWTLWSIAASCGLFALLYWVCDVKRWTSWAGLFRPAGSNTLLTYLLPDVYFFMSMWLGFAPLLARWSSGATGVLRALSFTLAMLLLSGLLTRAKIRLQL